MTGRSRVRLIIHFDNETGFDSLATLSTPDAEEIAKFYWQTVINSVEGRGRSRPAKEGGPR